MRPTHSSSGKLHCIPSGSDEGGHIPGGPGVKSLDVAMLTGHPVVPGGRHVAQGSRLHASVIMVVRDSLAG